MSVKRLNLIMSMGFLVVWSLLYVLFINGDSGMFYEVISLAFIGWNFVAIITE